ncbi:MAG: dTDP-glucose 4,6-dehydratase [Chitinispirillales bacterium]|jgi:dTDP-glucose 4,6-dehydratase|nr:dTDP-glucose 4,6-dehydratase [Chitinispirillales bacterium]
MKRFLITGGAGFIGSNFIIHIIKNRVDCHIVNYDLLTYAGNLENLSGVMNDPRYVFIKGDICDQAAVKKMFDDYDFDAVIHFAAESHVDKSITGPSQFVTTNVLGTQVLLQTAREAWTAADTNANAGGINNRRFIHVSTDEVYGTLGETGYFTESTPLAPNSPYSASKAGSDLLARAYFETFGFPAIITRCSNNYGPYQFPEKLIPLMIANALHDKPLPVYGDGLNVRDWLYVNDHCLAIEAILNKGVPGEVYNIGGNNEKRNIDIVKLILAELGKPETLITFVEDRLGHDRRYAIDAAKIKNELGWEPSVNFETGIRETIKWYLSNRDWWEKLITAPH